LVIVSKSTEEKADAKLPAVTTTVLFGLAHESEKVIRRKVSVKMAFFITD